MTDLHRPQPLDAKLHDRSTFDSGAPEMDEWLRRYATQNRRRDTAATWVITDASSVVVAYASIAMTGIDRSAAPPAVAKHAPDPVPALLIGRLAVLHHHGDLPAEVLLVKPERVGAVAAVIQIGVKLHW